MAKAKIGDTVKVHYKGTLASGDVFDTSLEREPLQVKLGEGSLIKGFEDAVIGMTAGDEKKVDIPKIEAYGERVEEMVIEVEKDRFPDDMVLEVGQQLMVSQGQEDDPSQPPTIVTVSAIGETSVTVDANHPLAGQDLTFEITLVEIG